jgi:hypothetical protein
MQLREQFVVLVQEALMLLALMLLVQQGLVPDLMQQVPQRLKAGSHGLPLWTRCQRVSISW